MKKSPFLLKTANLDSRFNIFFIKQQQLQYKNGIITSTINKIGYNGIT